MRWYLSIALAANVVVGATATAQRREEQASAPPLLVDFKTAVRFGNQVIPARRYRVSLAGDSVALADADTMLQVAVLPAQITPSNVTFAVAVTQVSVRGSTVVLEVRYLDSTYSVRGEVAAPGPKGESPVELAGKEETKLGNGTTTAETDRSLIDRALERLLKDLNYCIDRAHRGRWTGSDPRLGRCICPLAAKWRFSKVSAPTQIHRQLLAGHFGFSFTVATDGHVEKCQVWTGAAPPPADAKAPPVAPAGPASVPPQPESAPSPAAAPAPGQAIP